MTKAMIKRLDAVRDGTPMSVSVTLDGRVLSLIHNGVFRQRAPQPIGLAWTVAERMSRSEVRVFVMPHYQAKLCELDGLVLRVTIKSERKEVARG